MCKSIDDIKTEPWFFKKPWLIAGTGPSLANWKPEYIGRFNIWTINAAIDVTGYADICAFHDAEIYHSKKLLKQHPEAKYFLTRTINQLNSVYNPTIYAQLKRDPDKGFITHTRHNSSGFAWYYLGKVCGLKQIHCIGIDGGKTVFTNLKKEYQEAENGTNFNIHNHAMKHYQNECGYKIIKL